MQSTWISFSLSGKFILKHFSTSFTAALHSEDRQKQKTEQQHLQFQQQIFPEILIEIVCVNLMTL